MRRQLWHIVHVDALNFAKQATCLKHCSEQGVAVDVIGVDHTHHPMLSAFYRSWTAQTRVLQWAAVPRC